MREKSKLQDPRLYAAKGNNLDDVYRRECCARIASCKIFPLHNIIALNAQKRDPLYNMFCVQHIYSIYIHTDSVFARWNASNVTRRGHALTERQNNIILSHRREGMTAFRRIKVHQWYTIIYIIKYWYSTCIRAHVMHIIHYIRSLHFAGLDPPRAFMCGQGCERVH